MKANILDLQKVQEVWIIVGFTKAVASAAASTLNQAWTVGYFLDEDNANKYLDDLKFGLDLAGIPQKIYEPCPDKILPNYFLDRSAINYYRGYGIFYSISSTELIE
jgi:hypothetical protein